MEELEKKNKNLQQINAEILKSIAKLREKISQLSAEALTKEEALTKQESNWKKKLDLERKKVSELKAQIRTQEKTETVNDSTENGSKELERLKLEQKEHMEETNKMQQERQMDWTSFNQIVKTKDDALESLRQEASESKALIKDLFQQNKEMYQQLQEVVRVSKSSLSTFYRLCELGTCCSKRMRASKALHLG